MARRGTVDTSILLTLGEASALSLLWEEPRYVWHITPIVRSEVTTEPTRGELSRALLDGALSATELDPDSEEELQIFARRTGTVDAGEAEAIAVAVSRGWVVAIEDRYAQRRLREARVPWVNSATLLLDAVRDGRMSLSEADATFVRLDCYPGYRNRGVRSLADLGV